MGHGEISTDVNIRFAAQRLTRKKLKRRDPFAGRIPDEYVEGTAKHREAFTLPSWYQEEKTPKLAVVRKSDVSFLAKSAGIRVLRMPRCYGVHERGVSMSKGGALVVFSDLDFQRSGLWATKKSPRI